MNTVVGFIGPEYLTTPGRSSARRAGGSLHGQAAPASDGLRRLLHQPSDADQNDIVNSGRPADRGGVNYLMSCRSATTPMLNYQSARTHDVRCPRQTPRREAGARVPRLGSGEGLPGCRWPAGGARSATCPSSWASKEVDTNGATREAELRKIGAAAISRLGARARRPMSPRRPPPALRVIPLPDLAEVNIRETSLRSHARSAEAAMAAKKHTTTLPRHRPGRPPVPDRALVCFRADHAAARDAVMLEVDEVLPDGWAAAHGLSPLQLAGGRSRKQFLTPSRIWAAGSDDASMAIIRGQRAR